MNWIKCGIISIVLIIASSCSGLNLPKHDVKPLILSFSGTFYNQHYKTKWAKQGITILELLNIDDTTKHFVHLRFIDYRHLLVTAFDSSNAENKSEWVFKGRFKRRGYFEIVHYRKNFQIPLIYRQRVYDRIRIALTTNNELVIRNDSDQSRYVYVENTEVGLNEGKNATFFFKPVAGSMHVKESNH